MEKFLRYISDPTLSGKYYASVDETKNESLSGLYILAYIWEENTLYRCILSWSLEVLHSDSIFIRSIEQFVEEITCIHLLCDVYGIDKNQVYGVSFAVDDIFFRKENKQKSSYTLVENNISLQNLAKNLSTQLQIPFFFDSVYNSSCKGIYFKENFPKPENFLYIHLDARLYMAFVIDEFPSEGYFTSLSTIITENGKPAVELESKIGYATIQQRFLLERFSNPNLIPISVLENVSEVVADELLSVVGNTLFLLDFRQVAIGGKFAQVLGNCLKNALEKKMCENRAISTKWDVYENYENSFVGLGLLAKANFL